jgi:plasmid stabilization system protein ParE
MSAPIAFLPGAEDDIEAGYRWYERQRIGLGGRFLEALRELTDQIRDNPRLYGFFRRDVRAAPLQRFPYVVYYRDRGTDVLVIAVQHGRRASRAWQSRA